MKKTLEEEGGSVKVSKEKELLINKTVKRNSGELPESLNRRNFLLREGGD